MFVSKNLPNSIDCSLPTLLRFRWVEQSKISKLSGSPLPGAPGNGDPDNFDIFDCSTQRNLNSVGKEQSIELGKFFDTNNISIDLVLSSEWCRCKETANLAFQKFETFNALNSFYDPKFYKNKEPQLEKLINFINNLDNEGNIVFVTHYVVIAAIFDQAVTSGEILIADRNLNVVGRIKNY